MGRDAEGDGRDEENGAQKKPAEALASAGVLLIKEHGYQFRESG